MKLELSLKNVLHIVGEKNSGKTTLTEKLIGELASRGINVGSIKHSSHNHTLDKEGSDSDKFSKAGADPSVFATPAGSSIVISGGNNNYNDIINYIFSKNDLVIVESFKSSKGKKLVITDNEEYLNILSNVIAVISSSFHPKHLPVFSFNDYRLIEFIIKEFNLPLSR